MLSHKGSDKASRYLDLLDAARCNGQWDPELVRKVAKHAPSRKCLLVTADSEHRIRSQASGGAKLSASPSTELQQLIPPLLTAIENEKDFPEDVFQAKTCLAWLHFTLGEPGLAISVLPKSLKDSVDDLTSKQKKLGPWTHVCIVKSAYIKGSSFEKIGTPRDVYRAYESALPSLSITRFASSSPPEYRIWTEHLLSRFCIFSGVHFRPNTERLDDLLTPAKALAPFRAWAAFWAGRPGQGLSISEGAGPDQLLVRRRDVWRAYYDTISKVLQHGFPYPLTVITASSTNGDASNANGEETMNTKLQQSAELKRVEATYESLLLKETQFPKAGDTSPEIEHWVAQVMSNWEIICGPTWDDEDLGQGGQEAAGRNILDILYRAATKTFHSTRVLRHLFEVHASLAEFKLAGKALDTYLQIFNKSRARTKKSGKVVLDLDSEETALSTAISGIKMHCLYGRREEAEKAQNLVTIIEEWIDEYHSSQTSDSGQNRDASNDSSRFPKSESRISGPNLAAAYRAIGVSQAHWTRLTFDADSREDIHASAIKNFRKSLQLRSNNRRDAETSYALALVLAESRDIDGAIEAVKDAISTLSPTSGANGSLMQIAVDGDLSKADSLLSSTKNRNHAAKAWHLLALLLSARQNFTPAIECTEMVLSTLEETVNSQKSSESHGLNNLDFSEKRDLLEIKMTQLALIEVCSGPDFAVDLSGELLGLYSKLFNYSDMTSNSKPAPQPLVPPRSSSGTIKNIRASLFSRSKDPQQGSPRSRPNTASTIPNSTVSRNNPHNTYLTPSISVIDNEGSIFQYDNYESQRPMHRDSKKLKKRNSKKSMESTRRGHTVGPPKAASGDSNRAPNNINSRDFGEREPNDNLQEYSNGYDLQEVGVAVSHDIPPLSTSPTVGHDESPSATHRFPPIGHNLPRQPPPSGHQKQPPEQDIRLPSVTSNSSSTQPAPHFSREEQQRYSLTILVKVWLFVAGLYRRAGVHEEAQGAWDEAQKHVRNVEAAVATRHSSANSFSEQGWGGVKSVEELWADLYSEKGSLAVVQSTPFEAMAHFEDALAYFPDHPSATIGLSNILLDIYAQVIPTYPGASTPDNSLSTSTTGSLRDTTSDTAFASVSSPANSSERPPLPRAPTSLGLRTSLDSHHSPPASSPRPPSSHRKTPEALNRLAARDRAYGLLSSLTKLGTGWDLSEAWFALARAYEEGGQLERAKEVLWWVVELEDKRPIRGWNCLGQGYSL